MLAGVRPERLGEPGRLEAIVDRREAIHRGVEVVGAGGTLIILGKGHERFQQIGDEAIPFDDRDVALEALQRGIK
jgi:UDP-N-acetylmuramyl tripeptide synthase